jgi:hypothetical protein
MGQIIFCGNLGWLSDFFLQIVIICKVAHIYKMISFHVPWTFEWQITIYNVIGEFITAHIYYNTYYIQ